MDVRVLCLRLAATALVGAPSLVPASAEAAPLPEPELFSDEQVAVREVVSGREVLVDRADGSALRVRFPSVTVPEGITADGSPVCGANEARAALAALLPIGHKVGLEVVARDRWTSWVPMAGDADAAQYAADGALYADLRSTARKLERYEGSILEPMAKDGWLRAGTIYETGDRDPSEVNFSDLDRFTTAGLYADEAKVAGRGVYGRCGGDFQASAAAPAVPTRFDLDRGSRVTAVGGVTIRAGLTGEVIAQQFGPPSASVYENSCELRWPARGLVAWPLATTRNHGTEVAPPPRTVALCLARRITILEQAGPALRLAGLPTGTSARRLMRAFPTLQRSRNDRRYLQVGRKLRGGPAGTISVGLDRHEKLASISVEISSR